jgi:hypothetical protein
MMALNNFKFAEAYAEISLRDKEFHTAMGRITGSLTKLKASLDAAARTAQRFLLIGAAALAAFVKVAADAEETASKFNAVFKEGAPAMRQWAEDVAKAVGRSRFEIENTLSSFQAFFIGMGFGAGQAEEMSKKMQTLAIDFASFNNLSDAEASQRFISALSGSSEVLDMFGINIKQAALGAELLNMGMTKSVTQATEQEKALARLNIIFKAMGQQGAIGDAIRTQGSMANQFKRLLSDVKDLAVELGQTFMPIAKALVVWLVEIAKASKEWVIENRDLIVTLAKYGAIGLVSIVVMAKLASGLVAITAAAKLASAAMAFLLGISGPAGWAALAAGVTAATAAVLAMAVVYDELAESAAKAMDAAKKGAEEAKKAAAAAGGAQAAGGIAVGGAQAAAGPAGAIITAETKAVAVAEAELAQAKAEATKSEKRITENRDKAQIERDKKLSEIDKEIETIVTEGARRVFAHIDQAAVRRAQERRTRLFRSELPGVPSLETQETIRGMRQRDIDRAQARLDTARAAQRFRGDPRQFGLREERPRDAGDQRFNRQESIAPTLGDFTKNLLPVLGFMGGILGATRFPQQRMANAQVTTTAMSGVQALLQQRLNQQPTQAEEKQITLAEKANELAKNIEDAVKKITTGLQ